jgi:hypothetical protein
METYWKKFLRAGSLAVALTVLTVTACGGSGASSPPSAASILVSNGYTPDPNPDLQAAAQMLGANSGVTSSAVGENANSSEQFVWVFSSSALAVAGVSTLGGSGGGITVTQNGDVVTATGSESAWAAQGSSIVTDPNGDTCAALDANGYCPGDDPSS